MARGSRHGPVGGGSGEGQCLAGAGGKILTRLRWPERHRKVCLHRIIGPFTPPKKSQKYK